MRSRQSSSSGAAAITAGMTTAGRAPAGTGADTARAVGSAGAAVEGGTVGVAATPAAAGPESGFLAVVGVQAMAAADAQAEDVPAEAGVESPGAAEDTTPVAAEVIPAEVIQVVAAAANGEERVARERPDESAGWNPRRA
jgi:hypothetical protein